MNFLKCMVNISMVNNNCRFMKDNPDLSSFTTFNKSNTIGATTGAGAANPSTATKSPRMLWGSCCFNDPCSVL